MFRISYIAFLTGALWVIFPHLGHGQSADSTRIFTEDAYLEWVKAYHPVIQRADLLERVGAAYELKARGGFDPKAFGNIERKSFDGKTYFTIGDSGLKLPSWLGAEFKAGYAWTNGGFLNPENNLPTSGQAYAGVTWSLGRGLLIDERRATLQKAAILQQANVAERRSIQNDVLLDAGKAYWEWVNAYNDWRIYQEAFRLAEVRLAGVREGFRQGDKPAIDTLESLISVQNRQISVNESRLNYENASRILSNFLWYENELPVEISDLLRPPFYQNIAIDEAVAVLIDQSENPIVRHPELQQLQFQQQELEVDRRLKREQLKPQVDVSFNFLADGWDFVNRPKDAGEINGWNALLTENYKAGVKVGMPLFLRKERGDLQLADLKLLDNDFLLQLLANSSLL